MTQSDFLPRSAVFGVELAQVGVGHAVDAAHWGVVIRANGPAPGVLPVLDVAYVVCAGLI
jgi:hypothetical protein